LKEVRAWLGTAALLGLLALACLYLRKAEADRRDREALLKYVRETTPAEHTQRVKQAAEEKAAKERGAREAEGK
jgi:hypothetical protein